MPQWSTKDYCVRMGQEGRSGALWRDAVAELLATFLLVSVNILLLQQWEDAHPQARAIQVALGMIFAWTAIGYALGDFGGAHMNNAVTFACLIRREISILRALVYWIVQIAGAVCAAFFVYAMTPADTRGDLGNTVVPDDVVWWQAMVMEIFATLILCSVYLGTFSVERKGYVILPSLPVGMGLGLGVFIALPFSGASLNSVRSLGPAVVATVMMNENSNWEDHWVYWAGPMGGALFAAIIYWIMDSTDIKSLSPIYGTQSGTWSYGNDPPRRPQVMPSIMEPTSNGMRRRDTTEVLNKPDNDEGAYTINGMVTRSMNGGTASAFSRPPHAGCTTGFVNYN